MKIKFLLLLLASTIQLASQAQQCKDCETLLENKLVEVTPYQSTLVFEQELNRMVHYDYTVLTNQTARENLGFSNALKNLIDYKFNFGENRPRFEVLLRKYKNNLHLALNEIDRVWFYQSAIGNELFSQYIGCVRTVCGEGKLFYEVLNENTLGNFTLRVMYRPIQESDPKFIQIKKIDYNEDVINVLHPKVIRPSSLLNMFIFYEQSFTRKDLNKEDVLRISFNNISDIIEIDIPAINQDNVPIGTIVASTLNYQEFARINKFDTTWEETKTKWVPCDGRKANASVFGKSVPDLRGVFLRGLNVMSNDTIVDPVSSWQKDPDNDFRNNPRVAGSFQNDQFKNHRHATSVTGLGNSAFGFAGGIGRAGGLTGIYYNKRYDATSSVGGKESRPKNVAVYYYIKINN